MINKLHEVARICACMHANLHVQPKAMVKDTVSSDVKKKDGELCAHAFKSLPSPVQRTTRKASAGQGGRAKQRHACNPTGQEQTGPVLSVRPSVRACVRTPGHGHARLHHPITARSIDVHAWTQVRARTQAGPGRHVRRLCHRATATNIRTGRIDSSSRSPVATSVQKP
jgi:hypothetical protein